ncbi:MAG: hypothetical protein HC872_05735 [Gammaproteobacteria bacterium]|nr:hypothetical protein [Gammaproteobacteria bacterium]
MVWQQRCGRRALKVLPEYPDVGSRYRILCSPAGPFRAAKNHCDSNDAFQPLIELNEVDGKIYISGVPMSGVWPDESTVTAPAASSADQD